MKRHKILSCNSSRMLFMLAGIIFLLVSCAEKNTSVDNVMSDIIPLPNRLSEIQSSDLLPILKMVGNSKIIGVTEGTHFKNESLDFRNELIKFLVTEKRIDVVALESGLIESRELYDYVNGKQGDIDSVIYNGFSWTFDRIPQNKEIVEWLRNYNSNASNGHKVRLYGFDVPGSPFNPEVNRKMNTAINEALGYLKVVDLLTWTEFENRLKPYIEYIHLNYFNPNDSSKQYIHLAECDRNTLTGIINNLIKLYEINEINFSKRSSVDDYQWAYRAAVCSRQIDNWLRSIPLNYEIPMSMNEVISSNLLWNQQHKRDRSMVDNLDWIMKKEHEPKVLLFAHIIHLSKSATTIVTKDSINLIKPHLFGQYLTNRYGEDYKVIGNFYLKTKNHKDSTRVDNDALANVLVKEASKNYYRQINDSDKVLMNKEWKYGEGFLNVRTYMNPYQGIDVLFFTNSQTQVEIE